MCPAVGFCGLQHSLHPAAFFLCASSPSPQLLSRLPFVSAAEEEQAVKAKQPALGSKAADAEGRPLGLLGPCARSGTRSSAAVKAEVRGCVVHSDCSDLQKRMWVAAVQPSKAEVCWH